MLSEGRAHALAGGQILHRDVGLTQRDAVFVAPGNIERLAVFIKAKRQPTFAGDSAEAYGCVDIFDAGDGGEFKAGFPRVGKKFQRTGTDHSVIGYLSGGRQIAFQIRILHELHVAEIGEALAAHGIA